MASRRNGETLRWLDTLHREGTATGMSDGQLLERFLSTSGAAREAAFAALVRRHGPTVLALCRQVLRDDHASDDAFQATFLVLARRAATVRDPARLAPWLGRVARRIAVRARRDAAHAQAREERRFPDDEPRKEASSATTATRAETAALVGAEVDRLPETDRLLMRLTYWQGKTYEEAAVVLSWPIGTVRSRLARARQRLRARLSQLDLAPALALPPDALIVRTAHRASTGTSAVPASVAALVEGECVMMSVFSWKSIAALLLVGGTLAAGSTLLVQQNPEVTPTAVAPPAPKAASAPPMLTNGGIEDGEANAPQAWSQGAAVPGVEYLWSRDTAHGGKASLCLKKTAQRYNPIGQCRQIVDRVGDAPRLKVSAWVKAEQSSMAILDVQFLDAEGGWTHAWVAYIGAKKDDDPLVTHDWKRYGEVVAIPPGTTQIIIAPQIYGPGTVWFDDLEAAYTNAPATVPVGPWHRSAVRVMARP